MQLLNYRLMTSLLLAVGLLPTITSAADCPWEVHKNIDTQQDTSLFTIVYCGADKINNVFYGLSAETGTSQETFDLRKLVRLEDGRMLKSIQGYYALPTGSTFLIASSHELPQFNSQYVIEPARQKCLGQQRGVTAISGRLPAQIIGSRRVTEDNVGYDQALVCRVDIH